MRSSPDLGGEFARVREYVKDSERKGEGEGERESEREREMFWSSIGLSVHLHVLNKRDGVCGYVRVSDTIKTGPHPLGDAGRSRKHCAALQTWEGS